MMIGITTRSSGLSSHFFKFTATELKKRLFYKNKNTCESFTRGYIVTCSNRKSIFQSKNSKLLVYYYNSEVYRTFSTEQDIQPINFVKISNETLESLSEYFDELIEEASHLQDADVSSGDGVLTIKFSNEYGTYVINRQVPNLQIWLSSPKSGPKRYDFINGTWIYKHDGKSLHELLDEEIPDIVKQPVFFTKCSFGHRKK